MYETLSETEFNFVEDRNFWPNVFIDISHYLDDKIEAMKIFDSEIGDFPFPRSEKTIRSLAAFRGSQSGYEAAEAFELVYERR
jgi:LmbE family N-acetylglucosaminyl deacetylase